MRITFLGTDSVLPEAGNDTASYLVDGHTVIDTGFCVYRQLREAGVDMRKIQRVIFTHLHHDHYLGLPGLLFALGHSDRNRTEPLEIYAPKGAGLERLVECALALLDARQLTSVAPGIQCTELDPGESLEVAEYRIYTESTHHAVPGLAYCFEQAGRKLATICGDSAPHRPLVDLARGSELLIHEASMDDTPADDPSRGHSTASEAAALAKESGVNRLALVHFPQSGVDARLADARGIFPQSFAPQPGETFNVA